MPRRKPKQKRLHALPLRQQLQRRLQKRLRLLLKKLPPRLRLRILRLDSMQNLHQIARILKSNGTDGELVFGFRDIAPEDISIEEPVFICFDGLPVPFFIESFQKKGQGKAVVSLTGIRSFEDAQEVAGRGVYADASCLEIDTDEDFPLLEGWKLSDSNGKEVGVITGFLDIPGNPCLEVSRHGAVEDSVIIPFHEDLVVSVDEKKRELTLSVPAGLI